MVAAQQKQNNRCRRPCINLGRFARAGARTGLPTAVASAELTEPNNSTGSVIVENTKILRSLGRGICKVLVVRRHPVQL